MKSMIFAMALACAHAAHAAPPAKEPSQGRTYQDKTAVEPVPDNIGHATMLKDRTIVLHLIYWFPGGGHTTPTNIEYKPGHPEYKEVLRHLGGMKPGESKGVKPWPTKAITPPPDFDKPLPPEFKDFPLPETNRAPNRP